MNSTELFRQFPVTMVRESDGHRLPTHVWGTDWNDVLAYLEAVIADSPEIWTGWTYETH